MTQSIYRKIGSATLIMMSSIFLSRVLGVLRESVLAAMGGAGTEVDAYKFAFTLPEILNHIIAGGFLSITFIPIFSRYLSKGDDEGSWHVFSVILTVFSLFLCLLILIAMIFTPELVTLLAWGRKDQQFIDLAVRMTRIILPAQFLFFAGGLFMAVQFAKERFFLPALAPLIYNLGIIIGGITLSSRLGVQGFSWGALAGAFIGSFLIQAIGARRVGMRFRIRLELGHPDLRRYVALTLPLILGLTMVFSTEIFSKIFGSFLPPGGISWVDYALRIIMMLVAFSGQALGVASYPFLSKLAAEKRITEMNEILATALRYLALMIPISALVWVLRVEIVRVLFQRMSFTSTDTRMTALALSCMVIGATAFAAQTVVNRGFYAVQNTLLPAVFSTLTTILSVPLYWIGLKLLGVPGIGLAISIAAIIQVGVVYGVWNRSSGNRVAGDVYGFFGKILLLSLPIAVLLWFTRIFLLRWIDPAPFLASLAVIIILGIVFLILMALTAWGFKIVEIQTIAAKIRDRIPTLKQ